MSTETQSPKVQQGPNLRAAIAQLPASGNHKLTREELADAAIGDVASAINNRLVNDLYLYLEAVQGAARAEDGPTDGETAGISQICRDLTDELRRIGQLLHAIYRDENGMDVPERWS